MKSPIETLLAPWTNRVLFTAVRLRIFTILADQGMTVDEISPGMGTTTGHLEPFLDACTSLDLLLYRDGQYQNSQFSQDHLVEGKPGYIGDLKRAVSEHQNSPIQVFYPLYPLHLCKLCRFYKNRGSWGSGREFVNIGTA